MPDALLASKPPKPEPTRSTELPSSQMNALLPTTLLTSDTSPSHLGLLGRSSCLELGSSDQADHVGQAKGEPQRGYRNGNASDPRLPAKPAKTGPKFQASAAPDFNKTAGILPEVHL